MTVEHTLSALSAEIQALENARRALLAEIQDALSKQDFPRLSAAVGEASFEECGFSAESINSPALEYYARWWQNQRENDKALGVYKYVLSKKKLYAGSIHYYQSALVRDGRPEEAINVCLESLVDNPAYAGTYMDLGNLHLDGCRYGEARRWYSQAQGKTRAENFDIAGKLAFLESVESLHNDWTAIKNANFAPAWEGGENPPKVDWGQFLRLANVAGNHFAVKTVEWRDGGDAAGVDFFDRDAVSAGIAFQSEAVEGTLQAYQYQAVKTGEMAYLCPLTGEELRSSVSVYMDRFMATAYFFRGKIPFFLLVERVNGQRNGLYFPLEETYVHFIPPGYTGDSVELTYILTTNTRVCIGLKHELTTRWPLFRDYFAQKNRLALLANVHHMVGHSLLNEYPSLNCLFEHGLLNRSTRVLSGLDEFFNIPDVFSLDLDDQVRLTDRAAMTEYIVNNNLFVVRPANAAYRLPPSLRQRVLEASRRLGGEAIRRRFNKADYAFTVWFEVRTNDHICLNQEELACAVAKHLDEKKMGKTALFIAGWSSKLSADNPTDTRMIAQDSAVADRIAEKLSAFPGVQCFNIIGRSIYEKVGWGELADVHISTYGSGIIFAALANRALVLHATTCWYPALRTDYYKLENSPEVWRAVGMEFIEDSDSPPSRSRNYQCEPEALLGELDETLVELGLWAPPKAEAASPAKRFELMRERVAASIRRVFRLLR